jgi:hypothetical protein
MKKILLLLSFLLSIGIFKTQAQFDNEKLSFGLGVGAFMYSPSINTFNIHLRANYLIDEKAAFVVGFNYHLPFDVESSKRVYALDYTKIPYAIEVPTIDHYSVLNISGAYNYTFVHENEDPFSLHGIIGGGYTYKSATQTIGYYDQNTYRMEPELNSVSGVVFDLGIGANFNYDRINVFAETKFGLPLVSFSNQTSLYTDLNPVAMHVSLNVGARFNIFE